MDEDNFEKGNKRSLFSLNSRRSIREEVIINRLEEFFNRRIRDLSESLDPNFFRGSPEAVRSLFGPLNRFDGFHDDQLGLDPGDLQGATTIGQVEHAIVGWYFRNGWNVIHRSMGR